MTAESTDGTSVPPRVFISYARSDGEDSARDLRQRLQAEGVPLWQDRIGMEGGQDWWLQIVEALDQVEFLVLVMTPAALRSEIVRKEWRYARQQGVCVFPVKGVADLQISSLPHWMRSAHFYDLNYEWPKFLNDLNTRCQQPRVPFMVEDLPPDFVPRPYEFEALIDKLLDENREEPIAITAALRGAGGYGKTTMVKALCYDERIQQAFDDGILWVTLGENPGNLVGKVEDLIYMLNKERPGFSSIDAASARLAELLADRDILLVIDDVWDAMHLRPFLQGGKRCARLITTRNEDVLPANTQTLPVDAMRPQEAVQLLSAGLGHKIQAASDKQALRDLAQQLGEWPLLLKLANGVLQERVHQGEPLLNALAYLKKALAKRGLTAFDARNSSSRNSAVSATLRVSFELLTVNDYARYKELAIFPEDIDIPLVTLQKLWRKTGGMDDIDTEELCRYLYQHSMLLRFDLATRSIRLHDVIRGYLEYEARKELTVIHGQLLDAYQVTRWSMLPDDEPYLWDHLAEHLIAARRINELLATLQDGTYLTRKVWLRNASGIEIDITRAMKEVPSDIILPLLKQCIRQMSHLLNQCKTPKEVTATLHRAFSPQPDLSVVCTSLEKELSRPFLTSWHPFPSLINAHLLRILIGHIGWVNECAVSPNGNFIVSTSGDQTLKVWDAHTGVAQFTLRGHTDVVNGCAVSPDSNTIVSTAGDQTLKLWDAHTGLERLTLRGHTDRVNGCTVSPDGNTIISASSDGTLKLWDAHSGLERMTFRGHTDRVNGCRVSPDGNTIVSVSHDQTLKLWDAHTGIVQFTLKGHTGAVYVGVVNPDGNTIVSSSHDQTLKVWDAHTGLERLTLRGHTGAVYGCAMSPDGITIVSASDDRTLRLWDVYTGAERFMLTGHSDAVNGCAVSPDGSTIVSASDDRTLRLWDARTDVVQFTSTGHTDWVYSCAVSPDGNIIVSASDDHTLKLWDARTGTERLTLRGHTDWVRGCAMSPDGNTIVSASWDGTLKVWDVHTGMERLTLRGHTDRVSGCAVNPDGNTIISASDDHTLKLWDAHTGAERLTLRGHTDAAYGCAISPSGDYLVSASDDQTLKLWDMLNGICLDELVADGYFFGCAFSFDGVHLAAVGRQGVFFLQLLR